MAPGVGPALSERRRSLWRAIGLACVAAVLSPLAGPVTMIATPAAIALLAFQPRRPLSVVLSAGLLVVVFAAARSAPDPLWYVERGWAVLLAGGYVMSTALAPRRSLFVRASVALAVAAAAVAAMGLARPGLLAEVDWRIQGRFDRMFMTFAVQGWPGDSMADAFRVALAGMKEMYPALLALASLAAVATAEYVVNRMEGFEAALPPLGRFRFADAWVWVLVLGLALLIVPAGEWGTRTAANLVAFMGGLYVLRGAAILAWLGTSVVASGWSVALWWIAALLLYPVTLGVALVLGLSDTWLDLRRRLGVESERD